MNSETSSKSLSQSNENLLIRSCQRFNNFKRSSSDCGKAVIYLSLRKKGCPKEKAVKFCSKSTCRIDSTKKLDGPANYKFLRTKSQPTSLINGWQYEDNKYDLGKRVFMSYKETLVDTEEQRVLKDHFEKNEKAIKGDFKKKIQSLATYYKDVNTKYGFSRMGKRDLYNSVKEINEKNLDKTNTRVLFRVGSTPIIELTKEHREKNMSKSNSKILTDLDAFPSLVTKELISAYKKRKSVVSQSNLSVKPRIKPKRFINLKSSTVADTNEKKAFKFKNLLHKSNLFDILEMQNNYISKITDATDLAEDLERTKNSTKRSDTALYQIINGNLPKNSIAQEFNEANYVSFKESDKSIEESKRIIMSEYLKEKKRLGILEGFEKYQNVKDKVFELANKLKTHKKNDDEFECKLKKFISKTFFKNLQYNQEDKSEISMENSNKISDMRKTAFAKIFKPHHKKESNSSSKTTLKDFYSSSYSKSWKGKSSQKKIQSITASHFRS